MFKGKKVICIIAARGGSTGLPNKNRLKIAGKPIISYSITSAKRIKYIDEVYVSTENKKLKEISEKFGAKVIDRPLRLASDNSNILDAFKYTIQNVINVKKENVLIVLFWTAPIIRKIRDIEKCIEIYNDKIDCVVSVSESKIRPSWLFVKKDNLLKFWQKGTPEPNRQEQKEKYYYINGSIVVTTSKFLIRQKKNFIGGKIIGFVMDEEYSMDIDTPFDFKLTKLIVEQKNKITSNRK